MKTLTEFEDRALRLLTDVFRNGNCQSGFRSCGRFLRVRQAPALGLRRCTGTGLQRSCLFGGLLERLIRTKIQDRVAFYKAILWEHDPAIGSFRILEILGRDADWNSEERKFIFKHYKGRRGFIGEHEAGLLKTFLAARDGVDVETLYDGFLGSRNVHEDAKKAFQRQTGVGLRLDYLRDLRRSNAPALALLFYDRDARSRRGEKSYWQQLSFPRPFADGPVTRQLKSVAGSLAALAAPLALAEVLRRRAYGSELSFSDPD